MTTACDTCAFGKSGGAADEVSNRLKGMICAYGAIPFFCHHGRDGQEYDWRKQDSDLGPFALAPNNRKLCGGWRDTVFKLNRAGFFLDYRYIRRVVAQSALSRLDVFTAKSTPATEKEAARKRLSECMKFITARDIEHLDLPL